MTEMLSTVSKIFIGFAQKNISLSVVIVAILLGRLLLKKFQKRYSYLLWACLGVRALFDIGIRIKLPKVKTAHFEADINGTINSAVAAGQKYIYEFGTADRYEAPVKAALTVRDVLPSVLFAIWVIGILAMVTYGIANYVKVKRATAVSFREESGLYRCDYIESPIAFGFIRPRVYIPSDCDEKAMRFVIEHEKTHIRRGDVYFKLIAFLILSAYWVNPLAWVAFKLFNLDMELSCDEAVIRRAGMERREEYSRWLLYYSTEERFVSLAPTAFGETDTKRRVKNIMTLKKKGIISTIAGVVLLAVIVVVCFVIAPNSRAEERDAGDETVSALTEEPIEEEVGEISAEEPVAAEAPEAEASVAETDEVPPTAPDELTMTISEDRKYYRPIANDQSGPITDTPKEREYNGDKIVHMGYDIGIPEGTDIHAMCDGTVESVGYDSEAGNFVIVSVDDVTKYLYCHLKEALVKEGDTVKSQDVIAKSGNSGASTGPHLHVEIRKYYDGTDKYIFFCNDDIAVKLYAKGDSSVEYVTEQELFK